MIYADDKEREKENKLKLFTSQKETLDTLLLHGAITKAQYDFSLNGLKTKMHIPED